MNRRLEGHRRWIAWTRVVALAGATLFALSSCAGLNPNPGMRSADELTRRGYYAKALEIVEPRAQRGLPWAQYRLGMMYANGLGLSQDCGQALEWFARAALYEAKNRWEKGAEIGTIGTPGYWNAQGSSARARLHIAYLLEHGQGLDRDLGEAWLWMNSAYQLMADNEPARKEIRRALEWLESQMDPDLLNSVRARSATWTPEPSGIPRCAR